MIPKSLLIALPLALAACGQSEQTPEPMASGSGAPPQADTALTKAKLVVDANGVSAKGIESMRFGTPRADVDAMADKAFGTAAQTSRNEECGAGPMEFSQYGPLQLGYLDGRFAGWFLRAGDGVVTSDGIAPGVTTLDALKLERQVQELDTTLEGEFQYTAADYGTITGFSEPDGRITALAAGVTCFFR